MMAVAMVSPLGPMNSFFGATTRIMLAMGRKGQLPAVFTELHPRYKTPTAANILLAILALAGPFLGPNMLVPLTNISSLGFIIGCFMVSCACLKMRYTEPDLHRPYTVPLGRVGIVLAILACATIIGLLVLPFSPAALNTQEWIIVAVWAALGLLFMVSRRASQHAPRGPWKRRTDQRIGRKDQGTRPWSFLVICGRRRPQLRSDVQSAGRLLSDAPQPGGPTGPHPPRS